MTPEQAISKAAGVAHVVEHRHLREYEMAGNHMWGLATPSLGAKQSEVWFTRIDPNAATPVHRHDCEEIVLIVRGRGEARRIGTETLSFQGPCTLVLPANELHQLANTGEVPLEAFACISVGSRVFDKSGVEMALPWRE